MPEPGLVDLIIEGLTRNPLIAEAVRVGHDALDSGEGEREALSLLLSILTPMPES